MSDSWLHLFESRLEQLEQRAAAENAQFSDLFQLATAALQSLATNATADIWLVRSASAASDSGNSAPETLIEHLIPDGRTVAVDRDDHHGVVTAAGTDHLFEHESDSSPAHPVFLYTKTRVAQYLVCVLQISFHGMIAPRQSLIEGCRAVCGIVSEFVARHLLSQYDTRLKSQAILVSLITQLHRCKSIREASAVIAQDGASVLGVARVGVFVTSGNELKIQAVTGVREPNHSAEAVRAITDVAESEGFGDWTLLKECDNNDMAAAFAVLQSNGTNQLRVLGISDSFGHRVGALTIELDLHSSVPDEHLIQQLLPAARDTLRELHRRRQNILTHVIRSRRTRWLIAVAIILLLLATWPTTFEVEVPGRIVATNHRRIFAPEHGVIDKVTFSNEQSVASGAPLLQMSNADLELELRRLEGEIETAATEQAAVYQQRVRTGDSTLSGREQRLQMQKENLEQEKMLLNDRKNKLMIVAPFSGRVYRHNPQQDLQARPVQRGQLLLEVVPNDDKWQLELSIPDRLENYVRHHVSDSKTAPTIRYVVRAAPDRHWTTTLTSVDNAIQIIDGEMVCSATAILSELPTTELRPGTSITARINCGSRSVGFVWFREVVEFWQQLRFAWF